MAGRGFFRRKTRGAFKYLWGVAGILLIVGTFVYLLVRQGFGPLADGVSWTLGKGVDAGSKIASDVVSGKYNDAPEQFADAVDRFRDRGDNFSWKDIFPSSQGGGPGRTSLDSEERAAVLGTLSDSVNTRRQPTAKYSREAFMPDGWEKISSSNAQAVGWEDFEDGDCTVRQAVLATEGKDVTYDKGCKNMRGTWKDVYGQRHGTEIEYKTSMNPTSFDIDHIVPLSEAWKSGADKWDEDRRIQFAHDPMNLVVSSSSVNRSKGDASFDAWTPPKNSSFYCEYADRYATVKARYGLSVSSAELQSLNEAVGRCQKN